MYAELFAIISAISFSISAIFIKLALNKHHSQFSAIIIFTISAAVVWLIALFANLGLPSAQASLLFAIRGVFDPGIAALLLFTAFRKLGVSITVPIIGAAPLISTSLSVLFLKEKLTLAILSGTIFIISGVFVLAFKHPHTKINKKYILMAVAGSALIGVSAVIAKTALNNSNALFGGLAVTFSAAILIQVVIITALKKWQTLPRSFDKAKLFLITSIFSVGGISFIFLALSKGPVSVVMPLASIQPLISLFLAFLFLKKHENITKHIVLGSVMIVAGAVILTLL
ncbi:hypothetical protein CMO88_01960 [Candidatus Woesearchaeota archaeon]|nr:hypothetical protein [Candidatus Woesearchaeota archaeon]|tara:strand:+ start:33 stop:887 length:855 start_codon:yes stop_codon:yes gene_type:complete